MRLYLDTGYRCVAHRWRGPLGEIDLILEKAGEMIFVEVKRAKDFATAAARVSQRQIARLLRSAEQYLGQIPSGLATPVRFDVALVDGFGRIDVLENALSE